MPNCKDTQPDVHTTVRVPAEIHSRLREIAAREHRTVSQEVRRLIYERVDAEADTEAAA